MSILTVVDPAASRRLAALPTIKRELEITGGADDLFLQDLIAQASAAIEGWCNRVFAREGLAETFRLGRARPVLHLARWPVVAITSVVEDGTTLGSAEYESDPASGELWRLDGDDGRTGWYGGKVVVAYQAGYALPGAIDRDLPDDLERACIETVKARWFARLRDPLAKSEQVQGVASTNYWVPNDSSDDPGLPPAVIGLLARHRLPTL